VLELMSGKPRNRKRTLKNNQKGELIMKQNTTAATTTATANQEIEKKYLVDDLEKLCNGLTEIRRDEIAQGYLAIESGGNEVRLRSKSQGKNRRYYLTVKSGSGLVRGEVETEISEEQFQVLWPMTEGRRVEKIRLTLALPDGVKLEVDRFLGKLEGLIMAEVEFTSEEKAESFQMPNCLVRDVTTDKRFKNQKLALTKDLDELQL
jgi:adenylate cyclase